MTLLNTFGKLFSHLDIGSPELEEENRSYTPYISTDFILSEVNIVSPKCLVRAQYSLELTYLALDFFIFLRIDSSSQWAY